MDKSEAMRLAGGLAFQGRKNLYPRVRETHRQRYFRELGESWDLWYDLFYHNDPPGMTRREYGRLTALEARRLLPWLSSRSRFLDLGCGDGRHLRLVAPHCGQAHGADISAKALAQAGRRCRGLGNVRLHRIVSWRLGLPAAGFDLVYSHLMLSHLDPEPAIACLREAGRILKPGGRFVFDLLNVLDPANLDCLLELDRTNWPGINRPRFWTAEMVAAILPRCGLRIARSEVGRWIEVQAVKI